MMMVGAQKVANNFLIRSRVMEFILLVIILAVIFGGKKKEESKDDDYMPRRREPECNHNWMYNSKHPRGICSKCKACL